jgi:hypothetical protein
VKFGTEHSTSASVGWAASYTTADLAGRHRVEQEPPVQRGRVETAGGAQQLLVLRAPRLASRAPVKSFFELGAELFRGRTRERRIRDRRLPRARSDHVLGQIVDFLVKRLEPCPDERPT